MVGAVTSQSGLVRQPTLPRRSDSHGARLTLAQYAIAKHLPVDFLTGLGLHDTPRGVGIPYRNRDGSLYTTRTRLSLTGQLKVLQPKDVPLFPYGLDRLREGRDLIVVEGESDCHTLWLHGFTAVGVPGAGGWKREWRNYLTLHKRIYLYDEGNVASRRLANRIAGDCPGIRRLKVRDYKDPSDLHMAEPDDFDRLMRTAMKQAPIIRAPRQRPRPKPRHPTRYEDDFDIMATVSPYTQMRRSGIQWKGLCPLHEERTPSFYISLEKNTWFCHGGCGRGGGIKDFLQLVGAK